MWFRAYLRNFLRETDTEEMLSGSSVEEIKKLSGRKMRRLFDERSRVVEVPFPYNMQQNKAAFHVSVLQPLTQQC